MAVFQPTLPLRGATNANAAVAVLHAVSTHAPLAGSDNNPTAFTAYGAGFNPRSPCGERR